ncbi:MAG: hypothetical protein ACRCYX_03565 [Dermatophilaceae bacterium]
MDNGPQASGQTGSVRRMTEKKPPLHHPFLARESEVLGVSRHERAGSSFRSVFRGVVVDARVPDTLVVRSRAALLLAPEGGVVSHFTAARLWGGRVPDNEWVHVSFMRDVRFRVRGIKPHRFRHRLDITKWHGLPLTSPEQTFCHMAKFLGLIDLVALGDALVRKHRFTAAHLRGYAEGWEGQFHNEVVAAARLVRERVDSSPETALRLLIVLAGLPEPDVDIRIRDADGNVRFRIDLGYEGERLAIEYDGRWHAADEQRAKDLARRTHLSDEEGWTFVVVTGDELYGGAETLLERITAAARNAGICVPNVPSQAWRQHFRVVRFVA